MLRTTRGSNSVFWAPTIGLCPHPGQNSTVMYRSSTKIQAQRRPPIVEHSIGWDSDCCCCCCCRRREARAPSRPPRRLRYLPVYRRLQASSPGSAEAIGVWIHRKRRSGRHLCVIKVPSSTPPDITTTATTPTTNTMWQIKTPNALSRTPPHVAFLQLRPPGWSPEEHYFRWC